MDWRLLLFVVYRRVRRPVALALLVVALAVGGLEVSHVATTRCCTLIVTGYNLDTSTPNLLEIQQNNRIVAQASAFDGTIIGPERARFVLPPGTYTLFVTNYVARSSFSFSGSPRHMSVTVRLDHDQQVNFRQMIREQQADVGQPGAAGR